MCTLTITNPFKTKRDDNEKALYLLSVKNKDIIPLNSHYSKDTYLEKVYNNNDLFFAADAVEFVSISRNHRGITINF